MRNASEPSRSPLTHRLVLVNAGCPGAGKSTLAAALLEESLVHRWLSESDLNHLAPFARCAAALWQNDPAAPDLAVDAASALVAEHGGRDERWLVDGLQPGFVFFLGRYPRERLERYRDALASVLAPLDPLLVYLSGDPALFLDRALRRSGPDFLERVLGAFATAPLPHYGAVTTLDELQRFFAWADRESRALLEGWPGRALVLDGAKPMGELCRAARRAF